MQTLHCLCKPDLVTQAHSTGPLQQTVQHCLFGGPAVTSVWKPAVALLSYWIRSATWKSLSSSSSGWKTREIKQNPIMLKKKTVEHENRYFASSVSHKCFTLCQTFKCFFFYAPKWQTSRQLTFCSLTEWLSDADDYLMLSFPHSRSSTPLCLFLLILLFPSAGFFHCLSCQYSFECHEFDYRTNKVFLFACWQSSTKQTHTHLIRCKETVACAICG